MTNSDFYRILVDLLFDHIHIATSRDLLSVSREHISLEYHRDLTESEIELIQSLTIDALRYGDADIDAIYGFGGLDEDCCAA